MSIRKPLRYIPAGAALAALFLFYVAMRPLGMHVSDSYAWVNTVARDAYGYFFHPHHLLYVPLAWRWTQLVHVLFPSLSVWCALASMSAAFGCAGVAAFYASLKILGAKPAAAAAGAALVAFAFGYWFFSSDAEVYVVSASCALWAIYWLARYAAGAPASAALWAGAAAGFAALFHQTGIFLFVPAAVVFAASPRTKGFVRPLALFTAAFCALVVPAYLAAAWAVLPVLRPSSFTRWIFLFGAEGYGGWGLARTPGAFVGLARSVVGGQLVLDWLRGAVTTGPALYAGIALACAAFAAVTVFALKAGLRLREIASPSRTVVLASAAGFLTYAAFAAYFDPLNFEWWTIPSALLAMTIAIPALTGKRPAVVAAVAAAALVASANFVLDFSYRRDPDRDLIRNAARGVVAMTTGDDVIIAPSYLGVLIWREQPDRRVICPDELQRTVGAAGLSHTFEELFAAGTAGAARMVVAGARADPETARFVDGILSRVPPDKMKVIGSIVFFTGESRFVRRVAELPVIAVERQSLLVASGG